MDLERSKWEEGRPVRSLDQLEIQKDRMKHWASDSTTGRPVMNLRNI